MTGERGETGGRGVAGERGPRGDHGQEGHGGPQGLVGKQGERGPQGEHAAPPITRRLAVILAVLLTGLFMGVSWVSEHNSCQRQDDVRQAARLLSESAAESREAAAVDFRKSGDVVQARINEEAAREFRRALMLFQAIDCSGIFPEK